MHIYIYGTDIDNIYGTDEYIYGTDMDTSMAQIWIHLWNRYYGTGKLTSTTQSIQMSTSSDFKCETLYTIELGY